VSAEQLSNVDGDKNLGKGTVRKLVGWVRNVVLMNVYLDLENPGGSGFRVRGHMG
jgi:hypothetical protein